MAPPGDSAWCKRASTRCSAWPLTPSTGPPPCSRQTWDIPLVTDIYKWVTNGSDLSALDVSCLLLAVPATITYKVMFGESHRSLTRRALDAIMAAYPAPPGQGSDRALPAPASAASARGPVRTRPRRPWRSAQRLGNILTGLSYIACGLFEAQVDLGPRCGRPRQAQKRKEPRCPAGWRGQFWAQRPGVIWEALYVFTEAMAALFSGP